MPTKLLNEAISLDFAKKILDWTPAKRYDLPKDKFNDEFPRSKTVFDSKRHRLGFLFDRPRKIIPFGSITDEEIETIISESDSFQKVRRVVELTSVAIEKMLAEKGKKPRIRFNTMLPSDYRKGTFRAIDNKTGLMTEVRIGEYLEQYKGTTTVDSYGNTSKTHQEGALSLYKKDVFRKEQSQELYIILSIHPYDIAGMSTDRNWTSCMTLGDNFLTTTEKRKRSKVKKGENDDVFDEPREGQFAAHVFGAVQNQSAIAYVTTKQDLLQGGEKAKLLRPILRMNIFPYYDKKKKAIYLPQKDSIYPESFKAISLKSRFATFMETYVHEKINNKLMPDYEKKGPFIADASIYYERQNLPDYVLGKSEFFDDGVIRAIRDQYTIRPVKIRKNDYGLVLDLDLTDKNIVDLLEIRREFAVQNRFDDIVHHHTKTSEDEHKYQFSFCPKRNRLLMLSDELDKFIVDVTANISQSYEEQMNNLSVKGLISGDDYFPDPDALFDELNNYDDEWEDDEQVIADAHERIQMFLEQNLEKVIRATLRKNEAATFKYLQTRNFHDGTIQVYTKRGYGTFPSSLIEDFHRLLYRKSKISQIVLSLEIPDTEELNHMYRLLNIVQSEFPNTKGSRVELFFGGSGNDAGCEKLKGKTINAQPYPNIQIGLNVSIDAKISVKLKDGDVVVFHPILASNIPNIQIDGGIRYVQTPIYNNANVVGEKQFDELVKRYNIGAIGLTVSRSMTEGGVMPIEKYPVAKESERHIDTYFKTPEEKKEYVDSMINKIVPPNMRKTKDEDMI